MFIQISKEEGVRIDKIELFRRYMQLLKTTLLAFFLSTCIHVGLVFGYYSAFLWLNPDDPGRKQFYATTSISQGVTIGGRTIGGGGVQSNHHKSYLLHCLREHYKNLKKLFLIEFSLIYVFFLAVFRFFPKRAKLKEDTEAVFAAYKASSVAKTTTKPNKSKKTNKALLRSKKLHESLTNEEIDILKKNI